MVKAWLNSMQAHMIAFALSVIMVITALSVIIIVVAGPPRRTPMTVYDISRVVRGLPTADSRLGEEFDFSTAPAAWDDSSALDRRLAEVLASDLGVPAASVRFHVQNRSPEYVAYAERQVAFYQRDGRASPLLHGTVRAAVRQPDGRWRLFERHSKDGLENVWELLRASPWVGVLVVIPFSMWFSTLIARPVRAFAQAAKRVGDSRSEYPVPVAGPTEIQVAAVALNDMQARIREFVRERTALVGAIAHDLRTPLNNLRFRIAEAPPAIRSAAEAEIRQLDQLINSSLDYVESNGRHLSIEQIDLTSLIQSIVNDAEDAGRAVALKAEQVSIEGDLLMLRRLFANLIENALKFAPHVWISLRSDTDHAFAEIWDDGPGMLPSDLPRAFEPYFRAERSRNRTTGGIGLGLAIVRSVASAHGGTVTLNNGPQGGLCATVELPLKQHSP